MTKYKFATIALGAIMMISSTCGFAASRAETVAAAAQSFLDSLDETQLKAATMPLDTNERAKWSNLPIIMVRPAGLLIKDMADEQRRATHALMRATMSSQGYAKFTGIMLLEDLLHQMEKEALQSNDERRDDPMAKAFLATRDYENYSRSLMAVSVSLQHFSAAARWKSRAGGTPASWPCRMRASEALSS
jgi:chemotaxis protein histidine kinase CheA